MSSQDSKTAQDYKDYRREYEAQGLRRQDLALDPWQQFSHWLSDAETACPLDATSMSLATVSASGMPSARIVLMKSYNDDGLVWYTDSRSNKGLDIAGNPQASVLFYWQPLERQVRISGTVSMVPEATADDYFMSRPRASQLSAAATPQSQVVSGLADLERNVAMLDQQAQGVIIERPQPWVGYCLRPTRFEFWQGRPSRLHDRFVYQRLDGVWSIDRLAP
ncbi:MAG: pyridoxamine 5'-phosphate oxidase [Oceanospirillaceae bacterium]|jgi:pyridoxamine 5'-phosphate oxidase